MKKILFIAILVLMLCGTIYATVPLNISGISGVIIIYSGEKSFMTVTNPIYHYSFMLPYLENWDFEKNKEYFLMGTNGNKNIYINVDKADEQTDEKYLAMIQEKLLEDKEQNGTETTDIRNSNGIPTLVTIADAGKAFKNPKLQDMKQQNFIITKTNEKSRFTFQFSLVMNHSTQQEFEQYLDDITKTFKVDYMVKPVNF